MMKNKVLGNWAHNLSGQSSIYSKQNALNCIKNAIKLARGGVALFMAIFLCMGRVNAQNCPPNLSCYNNLISNPGFEESCVTPSNLPGGGPYWDAFEANGGCVKDWKKTQGSPHIIVAPFNAVTPASDGGNFYTCLQGIWKENGTPQCYREGIHTKLKDGLVFVQGQQYNARIKVRTAKIINDVTIGPDSENIDLIMNLASEFDGPFPNCSANSFQIEQQIDSEGFINLSQWTDKYYCSFVPNQNYDFLSFNVNATPFFQNFDLNSLLLLDNVEVWCPSQLVPSITQTNLGGNTYQFSVTTNQVPGVNIVTYRWDFGDGTFSNQASPTHTFNSGTNNVTLCIIDNRGCTVTGTGPTISIPCVCEGFQHITQNTTVTGNQYYGSHIIVDPGVVLTLQSASVRMQTGCKFLIKRNARMNVLSSTIDDFPCNNVPSTWGGIQVWGTQNIIHPTQAAITGNINFINDSHGIVFTNGSSVIRDVANGENAGAISAGPNPPFIAELPNNNGPGVWENHFGGIILTTNTSVLNTRTGINFQKYPNSGQNETSSGIINCTFDNTYISIASSFTQGLGITNSTFSNPILGPNSAGIVALNGKTTIVGSTFNDQQTAVLALANSNPAMKLEVGDVSNSATKNYFNNCKTGVHLNNVNSSEIGFNDFVSTNSTAKTGIYVNGENGYTIRENYFNGVTHPINLKNTDKPNFNDVGCNSFNSYVVGIFADANNYSLEFDGNYFGDGDVALWYYGFNQPAILNNQGSVNKARHNQFDISDFDILSLTAHPTDEFVYYYPKDESTINTALRPTCPNNFNSAICSNTTGDFFEIDATGGAGVCLNRNTRCADLGTCYDSLISERLVWNQLLRNGDAPNLYSAVVNYVGSSQTLAAMNAASPYLSDRILIAMLNNGTFTVAQKLSYINMQGRPSKVVRDAACLVLIPANCVTVQNISTLNQRKEVSSKILELDQQRWRTITNHVRSNWNMASYTSITNLLRNQPDQQGVKPLIHWQMSLNQWNDALNTIDTSALSVDEKTLLKFNVRLLKTKNYNAEFGEVQVMMNQLHGLGNLSSLAQSAKFMYDGTITQPIMLSYSPPQPLIQNQNNSQQTNASLVKVSPNPFENQVRVEAMEDAELLMVCISDMNGKIMYFDEMNITQVNVVTSNWPSGIYLMQVKTNKGNEMIKLIK